MISTPAPGWIHLLRLNEPLVLEDHEVRRKNQGCALWKTFGNTGLKFLELIQGQLDGPIKMFQFHQNNRADSDGLVSWFLALLRYPEGYGFNQAWAMNSPQMVLAS